ncbi:MAG: hypothetical protein JNL97_10390 [Verrucomicrobiales bacterium]|nr:hypothetical protein [Verrucomicrobiales bacterium]
MQSSEPRLQVLEAWERLTASETEAIEACDWAHLATLQRAKTALRRRLDAEPRPTPASAIDPSIASRVAALVAHERANLLLVERRRVRAEQDEALVQQSRWNLRRQMHSFGKRRTATWHQYS